MGWTWSYTPEGEGIKGEVCKWVRELYEHTHDKRNGGDGRGWEDHPLDAAHIRGIWRPTDAMDVSVGDMTRIDPLERADTRALQEHDSQHSTQDTLRLVESQPHNAPTAHVEQQHREALSLTADSTMTLHERHGMQGKRARAMEAPHEHATQRVQPSMMETGGDSGHTPHDSTHTSSPSTCGAHALPHERRPTITRGAGGMHKQATISGQHHVGQPTNAAGVTEPQAATPQPQEPLPCGVRSSLE